MSSQITLLYSDWFVFDTHAGTSRVESYLAISGSYQDSYYDGCEDFEVMTERKPTVVVVGRGDRFHWKRRGWPNHMGENGQNGSPCVDGK
jgi:hypothetical protein